MGKIFPVNCFLARDTVAFSPSHRFHIAVMVFSFGHEGVVLGAEFTFEDHVRRHRKLAGGEKECPLCFRCSTCVSVVSVEEDCAAG